MMSDREKTVIDCIDRLDLAGGGGEAAYVLATASRRFDWQKAIGYLERIGSRTLIQRFGWLADHAGADIPAVDRERLLRFVGRARKTFLGPTTQTDGAVGYDGSWRLFVNLSRQDLQASAGLARRRTVKGEA
jgi:predicted transcriptional regulator of viral defense system